MKVTDGEKKAASERRVLTFDKLVVERRSEKEPRIVGHAAVFNIDADIGGMFTERVAPGAFARAIKEDDVRALFNHDSNIVLGRNRAGTLTLSEDETGLRYEVVPPDTQAARDLMVSIERGDISQGSFTFRARSQKWDDSGDTMKRTLLDVELFDVSPVTFPAYPETDVAVRAMRQHQEQRRAELMAAAGGGAEHDVRRLKQRTRQSRSY